MIYRGTITCSIGKNYVGETVPSHGSDRYGHRTLPAEFSGMLESPERSGTEQNRTEWDGTRTGSN